MKTGLKSKLDTSARSEEARQFEDALRRKIVGQEEAIRKAADIYQIWLAGLNPPNRPVGNLLFLGPTGSGKTRFVEAMAECLFGTPSACIKIDCAEFQHSHEIAKLIGSPPGYLGHKETHPVLTQEALNQWWTESTKLTLLLFDEIEKASDALWQLLLGILDKATLTLGDNRRVDLSNCIIVLTSNLGAREVEELLGGGMGFSKFEKPGDKSDAEIARTATGAAKRKFSPEFMNRIDKVVSFKTLKFEDLEKILEIELGMVQQRVLMSTGTKQFVFSCTPAMKRHMLENGYEPKYGARHLKRAIERDLVLPFANLVSTYQIKLGDFIRVDYRQGTADDPGEILVTKEAEGALIPLLTQNWLAPDTTLKPAKKNEEEPIMSDLFPGDDLA